MTCRNVLVRLFAALAVCAAALAVTPQTASAEVIQLTGSMRGYVGIADPFLHDSTWFVRTFDYGRQSTSSNPQITESVSSGPYVAAGASGYAGGANNPIRINFCYLFASPVGSSGSKILCSIPNSALFVNQYSTTSSTYGFSYWGADFYGLPVVYVLYSPNGTFVPASMSSDGTIEISGPIYGIGFTGVIPGAGAASDGQYDYVAFTQTPSFYLMYGGTNSDVVGAIEDQTDDFMSTDGSSSIVDGVTQGGEEDILDRLGFVGTAISVPASIFEGLTSAEDSAITFPGISLGIEGSTFSIPSQEVDIWEYASFLETPCRTICTMICVILWLRGVKSLYDRIMGKEQEVTVVDDGEED